MGIGFTHELEHEVGRNDEEQITSKDVTFAVEFSKYNKTKLSNIVDVLLVNVQEGSLFTEKMIAEYLKRTKVKKTVVYEIKNIIRELGLDQKSKEVSQIEYKMAKISKKSGAMAPKVLYLIKILADIKGYDETEIVSMLGSIEKAIEGLGKGISPKERGLIFDIWAKILGTPYMRQKYIHQTLFLLSKLELVLKGKYIEELRCLEKILGGEKINENNFPEILDSFFIIATNSKADSGHLFESIDGILNTSTVTNDNIIEIGQALEKLSLRAQNKTSKMLKIIKSYFGNGHRTGEDVGVFLEELEVVMQKLNETYGRSLDNMLFNIQYICRATGACPRKNKGSSGGSRVDPGGRNNIWDRFYC